MDDDDDDFDIGTPSSSIGASWSSIGAMDDDENDSHIDEEELATEELANLPMEEDDPDIEAEVEREMAALDEITVRCQRLFRPLPRAHHRAFMLRWCPKCLATAAGCRYFIDTRCCRSLCFNPCHSLQSALLCISAFLLFPAPPFRVCVCVCVYICFVYL